VIHQIFFKVEDADHTVRLSPNWAKVSTLYAFYIFLALSVPYRCVLFVNQSQGYSRQGTALYYMERYREALDAFNKGLKFEPENAQLAQGLQQVGAILTKRNFKKY
jgi:tetratricopeptide (TPR) repeat protein